MFVFISLHYRSLKDYCSSSPLRLVFPLPSSPSSVCSSLDRLRVLYSCVLYASLPPLPFLVYFPLQCLPHRQGTREIWGGCSLSWSSSSLDERASTTLEAMLKEHTEDLAPFSPPGGVMPSTMEDLSFPDSAKSWRAWELLFDREKQFQGECTPSNKKGWKSCFFFVSTFKGWGFNLKWIGRDVDNSPPILSKDEAELVVRLRGIPFPPKPSSLLARTS
ncbi:hypothetical protein BHE74_00035549 [Ensete ventricosum]|nr:hypothetical protein BHE74_00035549 [Ensete ventricosum]